MMTKRQLMVAVRQLYPTISISFDTYTQEYRVAFKRVLCISASDQEKSAYYTNDIDDALDVAKLMHEKWGVK